jgi:hypothetical protein
MTATWPEMRPPVGATAAEVMPSTSWIGRRLESALSAVLASWAARIGWSLGLPSSRVLRLEVDLDEAELGRRRRTAGREHAAADVDRRSPTPAACARASGPPTAVNTPPSIVDDAVFDYGAVADVELAADEVHGARLRGSWCGGGGGRRCEQAGERAQEGARELSHGTPAGR